jgi:hypothetical protein
MVEGVGLMTQRERKYFRLMAYLAALGNPKITLTFAHIEAILGSDLPATALSGSSGWWSNEPGHSQTDAWLNAGWRVAHVSRVNQTVTFRRIQENE